MHRVPEAAYAAVLAGITQAENESGRESGSAQLLAVSKTQSAAVIRQLAELGQRHFAENYLQEALEKKSQLCEQTVVWHFIGRVQRRKARLVAENFSWVHTVDSGKLAVQLDEARGNMGLSPLQVCLQVNVSEDPQKGGVLYSEVAELSQVVASQSNLRLRGLMAILRADQSADASLADYKKMADLRDSLNAQGYGLDTLSMGMSRDYPLAIAAGATWVRVGQALFGKRER